MTSEALTTRERRERGQPGIHPPNGQPYIVGFQSGASGCICVSRAPPGCYIQIVALRLADLMKARNRAAGITDDVEFAELILADRGDVICRDVE